MSKLILTVGVSNVGKTTWANEYCKQNPNTVNLCRDEFRYTIIVPGGNSENYDRHHHNEAYVTNLMCRRYNEALMLGKDILISDTNLHAMTRWRWTEIARRYNQKIEFVVFNTAFENMFYNNSSNLFMLPEHVIGSQYKKFTEFLEEAPIPGIKYTVI